MKQNKLFYQDNEITIFLIKSKHGTFQVKIDTKNWNKVKEYPWHIKWDCKLNKVKAAGFKEYKGKRILLHTMLLGYMMTDHIDGDVLNNLESNLRECNKSTNAMNRGKTKNNKSGFKGVCFHKNMNKWLAKINVNNKKFHLGYYSEKIEAARAYNEAAIKYHGEFARINIL